MEAHGYAGDRQLYTRFHIRDLNSYFQALHRLEVCSEDIYMWMMFKKLKLNEDKTEFLIITSRHFEYTPTNPTNVHYWR